MPSLQVILASTSGHTEYVVEEVLAALKAKKPDLAVDVRRAELATPEDLLRGDVLLLASSTWNTGGSEGQLNPHMHTLLRERAVSLQLSGKPVAVIGLGDARYRYTVRAGDLLEEFVNTHGGKLIQPSLRMVNEPYGQENIVREWAEKLNSELGGMKYETHAHHS